MKKIALLLTCITLISTLSSCGILRTATDSVKIVEAMDAIKSYEAELDMTLVFYVDGNSIRTTGQGKVIEDGRGNADDYYYYQNVKTEIVSDGLGISEKTNSIEAYNEGQYFIYTQKHGGGAKKLCGPMEVEKFWDYAEASGSVNVNMFECESIKNSKNKDGTRTVTCSEYSAGAVNEILLGFGIAKDMFGFEIKDVETKLTYDGEYRVTEAEYTLIFDVYEKAKYKPYANIKLRYSGYDSVERDYTNINPDYYTVLDNIGLLNDIEAKLDEMKNATESRFSMDLTQYVIGANINVYTQEQYFVEYGEKYGKFYYDMTIANSNGQYFDLLYSDGKQTVKMGSVSQSADHKEEEARAFVESLIDTSLFNKNNVVEMTEIEEDIYKIVCDDFESSAFDQLAAQLGMTSYHHLSHIIIAEFDDGELDVLQSSIKFDGLIDSYTTEVNIDSTQRFE